MYSNCLRSLTVTALLGGLLLPAQDLRNLVERAQAAEQEDKLDEAVSLYEEILKIRPRWASAELNLGLVHHSRGDYEKAIQLLTDALQHNQDLHSAWLFRGASYFQTGRYSEAARDLKQYLQHKPDDAEALSFLANTALAMNDAAEAALAFAALARITNEPSAYFQLSESYVQLARAAMTSFSGEDAGEYRLRVASDEKSPKPPPGGQVDFENATRDLIKKAGVPAPSNQAIYSTIGAYTRLANAAIAKVIALAPASAWAELLRAQAAERSGDTAAAEKAYERAAAAAGTALEIYVRFGQFEAKQGRFDRALRLYERAAAIEPANARVKGLIGEAHALADRPEKAVPFLDESLRANPRETQTRVYLAQCLIKLSRSAEAVQVLEAAPDDPDGRVHYLLGRTYQQLGEPEKARQAMEVFRKRRSTGQAGTR